MGKRLTSSLLALVLAGVLLTACSNRSSSLPSAVPSTGSTVTSLGTVGSTNAAIIGVEEWRSSPLNEVPRLFISRDFSHWRVIPSGLPNSFEIQSVSFPDSTVGWIAGCNPGVECRILRTTNGGSSWEQMLVLNSVSSSVQVSLDALSVDVVWMEVFQLSAGVTSLQSTDSGGQTWVAVECSGNLANSGCRGFRHERSGLRRSRFASRELLAHWSTARIGVLWGPFCEAPTAGLLGRGLYCPSLRVESGRVVTYDGLPAFLGNGLGIEPVVSYVGPTSAVSFT